MAPQGVMANVLAANWNANKIIMTNLAICLVLLLIQGVQESPQLLGDLLEWGKAKQTNLLPMLRVLKELPTEAFNGRAVDRESLSKLGPALMMQSELLCTVVAAFLNNPDGGMDLRMEALEVAKNWILNHLIPVPLIQQHLLRPIMNYVVDFSQQAQQLNAPAVVPVVCEVVTLCLLMPQMKDFPQIVVAMFEWLGTRASSWIVGLCTGIPPEVHTERDNYAGGAEKGKASLLKRVLGVYVPCLQEFVEEMALGTNLVKQQDDSVLQMAFINNINTLVTVLADTRLPISKTAVDCLFSICVRVQQQMNTSGSSWVSERGPEGAARALTGASKVWRVKDGQWFLGALQSVFRHVLHNNTFRFPTHDLTFFHSDKACAR